MKNEEGQLRVLLYSDNMEHIFGREVEGMSGEEYAKIITYGSQYAGLIFDHGHTHIEDFSELMVRRFGEKIRQWLKPFYYGGIARCENLDNSEFSSLEEIENFDVFHFDDHLKSLILERKEDEEDPDFVEELKACAYNIIRENPGIERSEWIDELIRQYPTEVVDAYGTNPREVYHDLSDLWEMEYTDPDTHEWNSFAGWSEYHMTDPDALRDQLDMARERIRELETEIALLRGKANKTLPNSSKQDG